MYKDVEMRLVESVISHCFICTQLPDKMKHKTYILLIHDVFKRKSV